MSPPAVIIGIGNRYRRDDGAALRVIEELAGQLPATIVVVESDGEPARIIDSWADAPIAVVVETVRQGLSPGTVSAIAWEEHLSRAMVERNSHGLGILEAIALGRAVGREPRTLRLVGIEPEDLGWGDGLTDTVTRIIATAVELVLSYVGS